MREGRVSCGGEERDVDLGCGEVVMVLDGIAGILEFMGFQRGEIERRWNCLNSFLSP